MERVICCIDLKSFYASCECVLAHLNPFTTPLAVVDVSRGKGSVVLAVTPYLKQLGVPSRCRLYELPKLKNLIYAKPKMQYYLDTSIRIISIFLDYVSIDDLHIYSIDESFLDLTPYLKLYQKSPEELCQEILSVIYQKTKITATCGIGPNMFLAKVAMDEEAKHTKEGIAYWDYKDVVTKLHAITPLSKMWGIGKNLEKKLNKMQIYSVKDLAHTDVFILQEHFGIIGKELYLHAWGIDEAKIQDKKHFNSQKSIRIGQTLRRDYSFDEGKTLIKEMVFSLCYRLRKINRVAQIVHLSIAYSYQEKIDGFYKQMKLPFATDQETIIKKEILKLYDENVRKTAAIRKIAISASDLFYLQYQNLDLFDTNLQLDKERKLNQAMDQIIERFGKNSIFRGTSLLKESTYKERNKLIGGHNAK